MTEFGETTLKAAIDRLTMVPPKDGNSVVTIELCCAHDSEIGKATPKGSHTIRVTEIDNLADPATLACLKAGIDCLSASGYKVFVWASTPCTAGCPWQRLNKAKGVKHGDMETAKVIIDAAADLCERAEAAGGFFA